MRALALAALALMLLASGASAATTVVRIETSDYDLTGEPFYGIAAGIFRRYGLDVTVLPPVEGGANMMRDVVAGKADVCFSNLISIIGEVQHGAPIVLLAPAGLHDSHAPVNALVVAPDSPIRSAKDLDGKSISSPSGRGSAGALGPAAWIDQQGGDSTSVQFVTGIQPFDVPAALASGRIAAAEVGDPQLTMLLQRGLVKVLADPFDAEGDRFLLGGFVGSKAWVEANPDAARRFVAAMSATARWSNAHRIETGRILAQRLQLAPSIVAAMSRATFAESLTPGSIQPALDAAAKYGLAKPMSAADFLRTATAF